MFRRSVRLAVTVIVAAAPALGAQQRWTVTASGGYATELDQGSFSHGSLSVQGSLLRPIMTACISTSRARTSAASW